MNRWIKGAIAAALLVLVNGMGVQAGDDEIRIGVIQPLSGALASYGKITVLGIKMRTEEINKAGGIGGKKVMLFIEDNKGQQTDSVNALTKLVGSNKVVAVVAPVTSGNTLAIRRTAKKLKIPAISPTATNDKATLKNPYIFRTCFNDSFQGKIVANYGAKSLKYTKAAVMTDMNSDYSKGLAKNFKKAFKAAGGTLVADEGYQQGDTDFGAQLKKVAGSGAQMLFVPGYPPEVPLIIKQAKAVGVKATLCGADGWDNDKVIGGSGDNIAGSFIVGAFSRADTRPVVQSFIKNFKAVHKRDPGTFEALGYDTMSLLAKALASGADSESVRKGLLAVKDFEAVTGKISISKEGDAVKSAVILEIAKDAKAGNYTTQFKGVINP
ncbi:MAG: ABC transporter substrate-binding protein [Planctomycetota bacterium]|jgi:branched-chain amino acid transport system substrate-binding protein